MTLERIARMLSGHGSRSKPQADPETERKREKSAAASRAAVSVTGAPFAGGGRLSSAPSGSVRAAISDAFEENSR